MHPNVHSSTIYGSQYMEATWCPSSDEWIRKMRCVDTMEYYVCAQSRPTLCDPMGVARQAPLSMEFSRQEHWSGSTRPPPGDLLDPGIQLAFLSLLAHRQIVYCLNHWGSHTYLWWRSLSLSLSHTHTHTHTHLHTRGLPR